MVFFSDMFSGAGRSKESESVKRRKSLRNRICRIEEVESREMLSATPYEPPDSINVGIVYHEEYSKGSVEDRGGDTFVVSWNGGAEGTTLDKIVIDLRTGNASEIMYFNTDPNSPQGTNGNAFPFTILPESDLGLEDIEFSLSQSGQVLEISFKNFEAGKVFKFKIDVNLKDSNNILPIVPGAHFEGTTFQAVFSSDKYEQLKYETAFRDDFSDPKQFELSVPPDEYFEDDDESRKAMTAGVVEQVDDIQKPLPGSLSGYVYEDVDNDGNKDAGEAGIPGVWLELFVLGENNQYVSTGMKEQTDENGFYLFKEVEGGRTYMVVETQPDGYADGKDTPGTIDGVQVGTARPTDEIAGIHIGPKEAGINYNFGELKRASLSGYVYHDRNNDGVRDDGEEGISGVKIKLQVLNALGQYEDCSATVTDSSGQYLFENLDPFRTYRVVEDQPDGWTDGLESVGLVDGRVLGTTRQDDRIEGILLEFDRHGVEYNFGEYKKGSISGNVYEDHDNNGKKDPGEKGIDGVEIWLCVLDENGEKVYIRSTTTENGGQYTFDDLEPGKTYCVTEVNPEGYCDGETSVGTIDGDQVGSVNKEIPVGWDQIHDIYIGSGEDGINYDFGEQLRGVISGYVYEDDNENGTRDLNEKGIGGVVLTLWVWDGDRYVKTSKTAVTDENGYYEFDELCPFRKYQITEEQPEGYLDGEESVGKMDGVPLGTLPANDTIAGIDLTPGGRGTDYNFGERLLRQGSISGYVYVDANRNGTFDAGERGIGDVTLTLWKKVDGRYVQTDRTAVTDANGYYLFDDLDPEENYMIVETQPEDYDDGAESIGTLGGNQVNNDEITNIFVGSGQHGENYNFGELVRENPPEPEKGSLSGYVYVDLDKNESRGDDEPGIAGVQLTLWKKVGDDYVRTNLTAVTDANGYYLFAELDPNETYMIVETQPEDYDDGAESIGSLGGYQVENDRIQGIVLGSGQKGTDYNFGELVRTTPPDPEKGSLSGYVYVDANRNQNKDAGEKGISGVTLTLWKKVGDDYVRTDRTAVTDSNGYYIFANLDPNETYRIVETQPADYDDGAESIGSLGGVQTTNDQIENILVEPGDHGINYNFGELEKVIDPPPVVPPTAPPTPIPPSNYRPIGAVGQPAVGGYAPIWNTTVLNETLLPGFGGGGIPSGFSWHLSIVNAGYPRENASALNQGIVATSAVSRQTMILSEDADGSEAEGDAKTRYVSVAWTPMPMNQAVWYVRGKDGKVTKRFMFGPEGATPFAMDFNGDGISNLAVYHNGNWYIDINGNGVWDEEDLWCELGSEADQPVVGDWDGDGKADIGIFGPQWTGDPAIIADEPGLPSDLNTRITARPKNMPPDLEIESEINQVRAMKHSEAGKVRLDVIDHVFQYGGEGDQAFSGDFTGDGITKVGVYRNGNWYIDYNGNGVWDDEDILIENDPENPVAGGIPVVGDFNGDGIDNIGLFVDGVWHLDTTGDFKFDTIVEFGQAGDRPIVGDFDGDGIAQLAVYRAESADSRITQAPSVAPARAGVQYAADANQAEKPAWSEAEGENANGQGTLPEKLQRHGRTMRTPHTNAPLHRK